MSAPMKVAVIDDNKSARTSLARLIKTAGIEVVSFSSAPEFLEDPIRNQVDCAVTDVRMPGVDDFKGVDLQLAISFAGNQFQFSSDASGGEECVATVGGEECLQTVMIEPLDDGNFDTGAGIPFAGTANKLTPNLGWP